MKLTKDEEIQKAVKEAVKDWFSEDWSVRLIQLNRGNFMLTYSDVEIDCLECIRELKKRAAKLT